ncbi:MAG: AAA family ATPase [Candidatus Acidiferrales bacterium]
MSTQPHKLLNPFMRSAESRDFESGLRRKIVGQDEAVQAVVDLYQVFRAGLNSPGRPVGNLLFLGPTGAGKTRVVEATAEILFGDPRAVIKVDCAEFQHSHEIAKLIGSPPGYLGHRETHPLITQEALGQFHTEKLKLSFLLFDEIEKASDSLWQLLLGILDKATLTLGDNRRVDLSQTMIFMTSNLGGGEITELMTGGLGFAPQQRPETQNGLDQKVERTASEAAKRKFAPEFMNRIDKVVVFHPLRAEQLESILEIELGMVQQRVLETARGRFLFRVTPPAREFLLKEGTDLKYGARHLKRSIERHLVYPLASLLATEQVNLGDVLSIDWDAKDLCLTFDRIAGGAAIPAMAAQHSAVAAGAESTGRGESTSGIRGVPDAIWSGVRKPAADAGTPGGTSANTAHAAPVEEKRGEPKVNKPVPAEPRK